MSKRLDTTQEYVTAYSNTYNIDDCLLRLLGNLTLRDIVLSPAERMLVEACIGQLAEIRGALVELNTHVIFTKVGEE